MTVLFVSHSSVHRQTETQAWLSSGGDVAGINIVTVSTAASSAARS